MLQATYVYLQAPSLEKLLEQVTTDILANPPLHHDPAAAAQEIAAETAREAAAASEQPQLFDAVVVHDPQVRLPLLRFAQCPDVPQDCWSLLHKVAVRANNSVQQRMVVVYCCGNISDWT